MTKHSKQELLDYRADRAKLRKKIKSVKKQISKSGRQIKKQEKLIRKTETVLGKRYYDSVYRGKGASSQGCAALCRKIQSAEQTVQTNQTRCEQLRTELEAQKQALVLRKQEFQAGPVPELAPL